MFRVFVLELARNQKNSLRLDKDFKPYFSIVSATVESEQTDDFYSYFENQKRYECAIETFMYCSESPLNFVKLYNEVDFFSLKVYSNFSLAMRKATENEQKRQEKKEARERNRRK